MTVVEGQDGEPGVVEPRANRSVPGSLVTAKPPVMTTHPPLVPG